MKYKDGSKIYLKKNKVIKNGSLYIRNNYKYM